MARMPHLARVPNAPPALLGLANLRGSIMPVLSAAGLLHRHAGEPKQAIVLDAGELVGLAVDEVGRVQSAGQSDVTEIDALELVSRAVVARGARKGHAAGAGLIRADTAGDEDETVRLVAFAIGEQDFALPVTAIDEVLELPSEIAVMPDADDAVVGSAASRGTVLPLLSLRALLRLGSGSGSARQRVVVTRIGQHRVGLLVDDMRAILNVAPSQIDIVPPVLARGGAEARIQAICRLDDGERLVSILAADQLLREDITARLLQGHAGEQETMAQDASDEESEQFLLFRIGDAQFGMAIDAVDEVLPVPERLTPLPKAPAFVLGLMSRRGEVIPVIDQAQRFGENGRGQSRGRVIVARIEDLRAGFMVDAVYEVVRIPTAQLQSAPDLGNDQTRVFERVAKLDGEHDIVLIVNPRELLDRVEQDLLRALRSDAAAPPS